MSKTPVPSRLSLYVFALFILVLTATNIATVMSAKAHSYAYGLLAPVASALGSNAQFSVFGESVSVQADRRQQAAVVAAIEEMKRALFEAKRMEILSDYRMSLAVSAAVDYMQGRLEKSLQRSAVLEYAWEQEALRVQTLERRNHVRVASARLLWVAVRQRAMKIAARSASALPFEWIPVVGQGFVIGLTVWDIFDACQTARDIDELRALDDDPRDGAPTFCPGM